jgi:hypothetical protein
MAADEPTPDQPEKIKHVQRVYKAGVLHLYFRKGDYREGPLRSADGTPELKAEVDAILKKLNAAIEAVRKPKAGTIGGLLAEYNRSADFLSNARCTQEDYQDYIDELIEDIGGVLLAEVTRSYIIQLRDLWAPRGYRAANLRMQVLKNALKPVILDETDDRIKGDPFHKVANVRRPSDMPESHLIWTDLEVKVAIDDAIARGRPGLARAIALGRYAGFRRKTICQAPLHARVWDYDQEGEPQRRLMWMTSKRKVLADMAEDPILTELLESTANRALTIAYNADGNPWKERQLNQAIDRHMARLAKAGAVRAAVDDKGEVYCPLDIHGLRHARGVELAHAGNSDGEIQSQLAHATPAAAVKYRRQAQARTMADAGQDKVNNVRDIRRKKAARKEREQKL